MKQYSVGNKQHLQIVTSIPNTQPGIYLYKYIFVLNWLKKKSIEFLCNIKYS